jgi:hypothetical protein
VKQNLFKNLLDHPQFVSDTKLAIGMQFPVFSLHIHCMTAEYVLL